MSFLYPPLKRLVHKARNNLVVKFYPFKTAFENAIPRLLDPSSPAYFAAKDIHDRIPANQLNWRIITNVSAKDVSQAIVRNRMKRRYYSAFSLALKEKGYHSNGTLRSDALETRNPPQQPLKGTLEIFVFHKKSNDMAFEKLRNDAAMVIDAVRMHQQQDRPRRDGFLKPVVEKQKRNGLPRQKTITFNPW